MQLERFAINTSMSKEYVIVKLKQNLNQNICNCIGMQKFQYMTNILATTHLAGAI